MTNHIFRINTRIPITYFIALTLLFNLVGLTIAEEKEVDIKIGGQYRIMGNTSNFDWHAASVAKDEASSGFANQRFRTWLTVKPNENISAYLQVEMGHITWGEDGEFPKTYAVGGDEVGMETRRAFLTYRGHSFPAGKDSVEIRVSDTGCGIKKEDIEHIFDPFYTTKDAGKGTGLGLPICKQIIQDHNGSIEVESEIGQGSTFIFSLPTGGKES